MIIVEKTRKSSGISLKGDFFDLDRLYFAIMKFTGFHSIDNACTFQGYDAVCENLLGLCYEIRHAWQGDRDIDQVYNGIHEDWFDDYRTYEDEVDQDNEITIKFSRRDFPDVTKSNTYFSIPLGFPEAIFYALILTELLKKKDIFLQTKQQLSEKMDDLTELNIEYYYFQANEDIARLTLFTNQTLHALYRFIGKEKYSDIMNKFNSYNDFFLNCDLKYINSILTDYDDPNDEHDDPDYLYRVLLSFFK